MIDTNGYQRNRPLNPVHAILLGFPVALFTAVLIGDIACQPSDERQWASVAVWLIVGGLLAGGLVLAWVLVGLVRAGARRLRRSVVYFVVLLGMWTSGLINAPAHADGSGSGTLAGICLSAVAWAFALIAAWTGYLGVPRDAGE